MNLKLKKKLFIITCIVEVLIIVTQVGLMALISYTDQRKIYILPSETIQNYLNFIIDPLQFLLILPIVFLGDDRKKL